jgi:hypothetical protein
MDNSYLKIVREFLDIHYPDCIIGIIGGSIVTGGFGEYSDYDLVILIEALDRPKEEVIFYLNMRFEVSIHNKDTFLRTLEEERLKGIPVLTVVSAFGEIVKGGKEGYFLINNAKRNYAAGPLKLTEGMLDKKIREISRLFKYAYNSKNKDVRMTLVNLLSLKIPDIILRINERWSGKGKRLVRELGDFDNVVKNDFLNSINHFYQTDNLASLERFYNNCINSRGIKVNDISTSLKDIKRFKITSLDERRYFITDSLYDLIDNDNESEKLIIANTLSLRLIEYILRENDVWRNDEFQIAETIREFNSDFFSTLCDCLSEGYFLGEYDRLINFVDCSLEPYGGRTF